MKRRKKENSRRNNNFLFFVLTVLVVKIVAVVAFLSIYLPFHLPLSMLVDFWPFKSDPEINIQLYHSLIRYFVIKFQFSTFHTLLPAATSGCCFFNYLITIFSELFLYSTGYEKLICTVYVKSIDHLKNFWLDIFPKI